MKGMEGILMTTGLVLLVATYGFWLKHKEKKAKQEKK